ncbi:MAG: metallophosphatase family protein [Actinobacteria bacterium]|nr:metallophosphatase family protein [Actinomycetota bacterium]
MKYAIISDIHSNLEAFQVVIDRIHQEKVDKIICLGDLVGYNANPNECVELAKDENIQCILGNHDAAVIGKADINFFNIIAKQAILWTKKKISPKNFIFLESLSENCSIDSDFFIVHGSPVNRDEYIFTLQEARHHFEYLLKNSINLCFFGHTHRRAIYHHTIKGNFKDHTGKESLKLRKMDYYMINPGGVGQPRDYDSRSSFLFYDSDKNKIEMIRLEYDIEKCAQKVLDAGLDTKLAQRLFFGM